MGNRNRIDWLLAFTALGASMVGLAASAAELSLVSVPYDPPRTSPPYDKAVMVGGISADGSVIVGTLNPALATERSGFVWTQAGGLSLVGNATLGSTLTQRFTATGVSNDGSVIVGTASLDMFGQGESGGAARAYMWTSADGFVDLGFLSSAVPFSTGLGVSGDGSAVVGLGFDSTGASRGWRWTQADGMVDIGAFSNAYPMMAASYDGSVIAGNAVDMPDPYVQLGRASVWTESDGLEKLPLLNGGNQSWARDISDDGEVIVGLAYNSGAGGQTPGMHAARWVLQDGAYEVEDLAGNGLGGNQSEAYGVSGNGFVVVGQAQVNSTTIQRGFRWTAQTGMQTVEDWLRDSGAVIATDITYIARAASCDGSVVVGETGLATVSNRMFIARGNGAGSANCAGGDTGGGDTGGGDTGGGDTGGVGLIIVDEFNSSLASAGAANVTLLGNINLLLNGAGSRPLDRSADPGKSVAWIGGDWGRLDTSGSDGYVGLGEIGVGHNFGSLQVNAVAGFTRFDQDMALGGRAKLSAGYVKAEALSHLYATAGGGLWGAFTASATWGEADMTRNYLNGGVIDSSRGTTDAHGYGVRGRLQWENAIQYVSPYGDLSYSKACFDAYSETGGGFPAAFDKLCDASTELRYGFDVTYPVTTGFRLTGTLEGAHRFEDKSSNVTGAAIGLYAFDLGGIDYEQDWLRAGAGFEADIGRSTLSVMGNVTTQSSGSNAWLAANWRVKF